MPEVDPLPLGAKITAKVTLWPTLSVIGRLSPFKVNDPLDTLAPDRVTLALPVLVSVSIKVCELPDNTLPNARAAGDGVICPVPPPPLLETPAPDKLAEAEVLDPPFLQ